MRLILALLAASICWSQPTVSSTTPVVVEWPPTFMRFNDNVSSGYLFGDTLYTAINSNGNRYFMCNDCRWTTLGSVINVLVNKMTTYDNTVANNNAWGSWVSAAFQVAYLLTETTSPNCSGGCTVRTRGFWCMAGKCGFAVDMEAGDGNPQAASIVRTDNIDASPPLWKNPVNIAGAGNSNGDMPNWTAEDSSVMFKSTTAPRGGSIGPTNSKFGHLLPIIPGNYIDDGVHCPTIPASMGGDGAGTYAYFYSDDGLSLYGPHRVSCANLWNLSASDWQTWTGSAWSSTLSSTQTIADLCWCISGSTFSPLYGAWNLGSSFQITLLPDLGIIAGVGQVYQNTYTALPITVYDPTLQLSTTASIFGPFAPVQSSQLPTPTFQTGTNPRTRKLNGAVSASSPGASDTITMSVPYQQGLEPQETNFLFTIDAELLRTNFASLAAAVDATAWPVIRGINGSAPSHLTLAEVQAPIRNLMNLASFVAGSYTYANGRACMDLIADIGQSDASTNDNTKANAVYSPGVNIVCFTKAPQQKTNVRGNTPIRLQKGHMGKLAFDPTNLVSFMDFNEHNSNPYYGKITLGALNQINLLQPGDLVGTLACTPSADVGGGDTIHWGAFGLNFDQGAGYSPKCITTGNFPITGAAARSVTVVFNTSDLSSTPMPYQLTNISASGQNFDGWVNTTGFWANCFNTIACVATGAGVITANNWFAVTTVYNGGPTSTGIGIYINGAYNCGFGGTVTCATAAGDGSTLNTAAAPITFGGIGPAFTQKFSGQLAGFIVHNAALSTPAVTEFYSALKAAYARRGIALP